MLTKRKRKHECHAANASPDAGNDIMNAALPQSGTRKQPNTRCMKRAALLGIPVLVAITGILLLIREIQTDRLKTNADKDHPLSFAEKSTPVTALETIPEPSATVEMANTTEPPPTNGKPTRFIPPSEMERSYAKMWNHGTSTIDVPEEYKTPFDEWVTDETGKRRRPLTSLEILQEVLHGTRYRADLDKLEAYLGRNDTSQPAILDLPRCLVPNTASTRALADTVVEARRQTPERQPRPKDQKQSKHQWPYDELALPLPILNGAYANRTRCPRPDQHALYSHTHCPLLATNRQSDSPRAERRPSTNISAASGCLPITAGWSGDILPVENFKA